MSHSIIQKDFYRATGQWLSKFGIWKKCFSPSLHYVYLLRKSQQSKDSIFRYYWKIILRHYQIKYGIQIYPETQIGEGLYIGHWGSLVINPNAVIGRNCNIAQGAIIGQQNRGKKIGCPVIKDNVWIGAYAVIVGGITIGNDVLIAANAYVNFDVPDHSIVLGNPGKIIPKENATEGYINNRI